MLHQARRIHLPQLAAALLVYMSADIKKNLMAEARVMFTTKADKEERSQIGNCQKFVRNYANQIAATPNCSKGTLILPPASMAIINECTSDFRPEQLTAFQTIHRILRHTSYKWILAKPKLLVSKAFVYQCIYQSLLQQKRLKMFENELIWQLRTDISNVMVKIGEKFGHDMERFPFWDHIFSPPKTINLSLKAVVMPVANAAETLASTSARALASPDIVVNNRETMNQMIQLAMTKGLGSFELKMHPKVKNALIEFMDASLSSVC